ncbi:MAG: hypothetical protein ACO1OB_15465 [Archangium sp.]
MHHTPRFVALIALTLAACVPPTEPEPDNESPATSQLTAEIGPEGGTLEAPADSLLAGVKLRVPPGAVAAKTTFTIDGQLAATQLSGDAEQVGPQFVIGPADATFASPLELTVPIDLDALEHHEQGPDECKVWHLTGETWKRLERTSGTENSVTVQLPSPGIAAAGVLVRAGISQCFTNPGSCRAVVKPIVGNDCVSASGYCISKLRQPTAHPTDLNPGFIVKNRQLYYAHVPSAGRITVARYDLGTGQTVTFTSHPVPGLSRVAETGIAVDANGDAWLGLQNFGNVRFGENKAPVVFDVGSNRNGRGAVMVGNVAWRLVFQNGEMKVTDGTVTHVIDDESISTGVSRPGASNSFLSLRDGKAIIVDVSTGEVSEPFSGQARNINTKEVAASWVNSGFSAQMVVPGDNVNMQRGNGTQTSFSTGIKFLAYDADDRLHGVPLVADLKVFDSAGGLAVVPLEGPNGEASNHLRMQPVGFVAVPGRRELVLVTRGLDVPRQRDFFLIEKAD